MLKTCNIINSELNYMLSSIGHTDILLITDAGYPIPSDAWVVDLSIERNLPDLVPVLEIISRAFIAEKVIYADYIPNHNVHLYKDLLNIFNDCEHETVPHETMLIDIGKKAKGFIRTGAYNPWGNIALVAGVDLNEWFDREGTSMPTVYMERAKQFEKGEDK